MFDLLEVEQLVAGLPVVPVSESTRLPGGAVEAFTAVRCRFSYRPSCYCSAPAGLIRE